MSKVDLFESLLRLTGVFMLAFVAYGIGTWLLGKIFYDVPMAFGPMFVTSGAGIAIGWVFAKMPQLVIAFVWGKSAYTD